MADDLTGLAAALAPHVGEPPADAGAVQGELLADEITDEGSFLGMVAREGEAAKSRGRPAGSKNRRTEEWARFILSQRRSPLLFMAEICATPLADLARTMACTKLEAAEFARKCASDLAPYLHQRQPQAIAVEGANAGMLTIIQFGAPGGPDLGAFGLAMQVQQNQGVSEAIEDASHGDASHDEA